MNQTFKSDFKMLHLSTRFRLPITMPVPYSWSRPRRLIASISHPTLGVLSTTNLPRAYFPIRKILTESSISVSSL